MIVTYIELIIFILAVCIGYNITNKLWPIESFKSISVLSINELKKRYQSTFKTSIISMIALTPIVVWFAYFIIESLILFRLSFLYDVTHLILPSTYLIVFLSLLLGTYISTSIISAFINNTILADWEDYLYFVNNKFRFNVVTTFYYFRRISMFLITALSYLTMDWFFAFGNEEIKINTFWGIGTAKYAYNQVTDIIEIHSASITDNESINYKIYFKDGNVWNAQFQGLSNYKQNRQIIWFTSERSGIPVKEVTLD
jgi:hypothetical protein